MATFAERVKYLRTQSGLSQREFSEKMNVVRSAVTKWESGASMPPGDTISRIANHFGVTTDYLLGEEKSHSLSAKIADSIGKPIKQSLSIPPEAALYLREMMSRKGWSSPAVASAVSGKILSPDEIGKLLDGESPHSFDDVKIIDFFYKFPPDEVIKYYKLARLQVPDAFINVETQIKELADQLSLSSDGSTEAMEWAINYFKQQYEAAVQKEKIKDKTTDGADNL
jgi:transcriptional regulator with XRE-family HTH domain